MVSSGQRHICLSNMSAALWGPPKSLKKSPMPMAVVDEGEYDSQKASEWPDLVSRLRCCCSPSDDS